MPIDTLAEAIGLQRRTMLDAPLQHAKGLPGRIYHDPEIWDLERRTVFRKGWFAAAYASELPEQGDVLPISIAGWELVFARGPDGRVRCFHNICRHRGTKLVMEKANVRSIRCGWHCWTYSLSGELTATPLIGGHRVNEAEGLEHAGLGLLPVRVEQWMDALFVNIDGQAPPLSQHLQPLEDHLKPYEIADVRLGAASVEEVEISANWKVFLEGGLEGYHLPWVHPALEQPTGYEITVVDDCFIDTAGSLARYPRLGTADGAPPRFPFLRRAREAEAAGERLPYAICFTVPTAIVAAWPEHLMITMVRPVSIDCTRIRRRFYFLGDAATDPATQEARRGMAAFHDKVAREDLAYAAEVHRLGRLRDEIELDTRFAPYWEAGVHAFQQYIMRNTAV
jgi:choline monooxygenase